MKLGQKIGIGFGIVLVVLAAIVIVGLTALRSADSGFQQYRGYALLTNEAGRIQANILEGRLAVVKFEVLAKEGAGKAELNGRFDEFYMRFDNVQEFIQNGIELADDDQLIEVYQQLAQAAVEYRRTVDTIRSLAQEPLTPLVMAQIEDLMSGKLDVIGPQMADEIEEIKLNLKAKQDELGPRLQAANQRSVTLMIVVGIIAIILGIIAAIVITRMITKPIIEVVGAAEMIAVGDLSQELHAKSNDEIGVLTNAFADMTASLRKKAEAAKQISDGILNMSIDASGDQDILGKSMIAMKNNLADVIREITQTSDLLASASEQFISISSQMSSNSEETDSQAANVSASAEETSSIVENIAAMTEEMTATLKNIATNADDKSQALGRVVQSIEESSDGINNVASAMEEMTASINEVAKSTSQASEIADTASRRGQEVQGHMEKLDEVVKQVSKIVDTIKDIADQTNMLALNATIEAAGAGEAGKGFAVVANEVKELARQSADAAGDIGSQIETMLGSSQEVVQSIDSISKVLDDVASINQSIAASMTQQSSTANDISGTVASVAQSSSEVAQLSRETSTAIVEIASHANEAATTADELSRNVSEATGAVRDIARSIEMISSATRETVEGAASTHQSAQDLSQRALSLKEIVGKFTV